MDSSFVSASAPGRLDVMGGIADYSGSLVLQMPIREETVVRIGLRDDFQCVVQSVTAEGEKLTASLDYRKFLISGEVDYSFARQQFASMAGQRWTAYVIGVALLLQKEKGIDFRGADFGIRSSVPMGKGVSSSASLEVATMKGLGKLFRIAFAGTELPRLAQRVENEIVGAPCGLMDQLSTFFGTPHKLLPILCQPDLVYDAITLPEELHFMGIDSGVRHTVGGSFYTDVRCAAFMGYSVIARMAGVNVQDLQEAFRTRDFSKLPYGGHLANIKVFEFEDHYKMKLPDRMTGKEFKARYGRTIDKVTTVSEDKTYSLLASTAHPIYEMDRVQRFQSFLQAFHPYISDDSKRILLKKMGELMVSSHRSYSACALGSDRTDEIVEMARDQSNDAVYGAKITGGGSGGTVCLLAAGELGMAQVRDIHQVLCRKYDEKLVLFEA